MDTTQLYYYFFHKTPNMNLQRVVMILGASMEFNKMQNSEIVERPSDNEEIPQVGYLSDITTVPYGLGRFHHVIL